MTELTLSIGGWVARATNNARWIVLLGALRGIAGFLAIGSPLAGGRLFVVVVGYAMAVGGVARTMGVFIAGSFGQGTLALFGGILTFGAGLTLVGWPGMGLATLSLILAGYLLVDGIWGVLLALHVWPVTVWGLMLLSAVVSVVLGVLLLRGWPLSGASAIGTLVGINLAFSGFSMISLGFAARSLARKAAGAFPKGQ